MSNPTITPTTEVLETIVKEWFKNNAKRTFRTLDGTAFTAASGSSRAGYIFTEFPLNKNDVIIEVIGEWTQETPGNVFKHIHMTDIMTRVVTKVEEDGLLFRVYLGPYITPRPSP